MAFLAFKKAYDACDTVSRPFLFGTMEAVGAGPALIRWVQTLLRHTCTAARVNNHRSTAATYHAGMRQGCPLAPLLYLFIAWARSCWLEDCPALGMEVTPGRVLHFLQYADDA